MRMNIRVNEIIDKEIENEFFIDRDELRRTAKEQIIRIQDENRKSFDKKRKEATKYKLGEMVAIARTHSGTGMKLRPTEWPNMAA